MQCYPSTPQKKDKGNPLYRVEKSLILFDNQLRVKATPIQLAPKMIIQLPSPFSYKDDKAVS